jgi:hypothetical protein
MQRPVVEGTSNGPEWSGILTSISGTYQRHCHAMSFVLFHDFYFLKEIIDIARLWKTP